MLPIFLFAPVLPIWAKIVNAGSHMGRTSRDALTFLDYFRYLSWIYYQMQYVSSSCYFQTTRRSTTQQVPTLTTGPTCLHEIQFAIHMDFSTWFCLIQYCYFAWISPLDFSEILCQATRYERVILAKGYIGEVSLLGAWGGYVVWQGWRGSSF
jgi:hypothetical protein